MKIKNAGFLILKLMLLLGALQIVRAGLVALLSAFFEPDLFLRTCLSSIVIGILFLVVVVAILIKKIPVSLFPKPETGRQKKGYAAAAAVWLLLLLTTPVFSGGYHVQVIIPLLYSTILIPLYEELIFRGYIWSRLKTVFRSELVVCILTAVLFAAWHFGYADSILFTVSRNGTGGNMVYIMEMKALTGLLYGIVTGFARSKAGNCTAGFLLHSALNVFGR